MDLLLYESDLHFQLYELFGCEALLRPQHAEHDRAAFDAARQIAGQYFAPRNQSFSDGGLAEQRQQRLLRHAEVWY